MNVTQHHPKVKVTLGIPNTTFVAGDEIRGKFSIESRSEGALGLATISVELLAVQELTSRDHAATSTFHHTRRVFQGPGLPVSNAVLYESPSNSTELPRGYHPARKGQTSFFFSFPVPTSSPSSINFGRGLAQVRYEIIAHVEVFWKGERRVVTDQKKVEVTECLPQLRELPPAVLVGEGGRLHVRARLIGLFVILGQTGCVELFLQNHSNRKTTGVTLTLRRKLELSRPPTQEHPFTVTDTLVNIPFSGPEYCVPPGGEGVANLVFDVPWSAISSMGALREGDPTQPRKPSRSAEKLIFGVECEVMVTIGLGVGAKDVVFPLLMITTHPQAVSPVDAYTLPPPPPLLPNGEVAYTPPYLSEPNAPLEPPRRPFAHEQYSTPPSPQFNPHPAPSRPPYQPNHPQPAPTHYFPQYSSQPTTPLQGTFNLAPGPTFHYNTPQTPPLLPPLPPSPPTIHNQTLLVWGRQWTPPVQLDNGAQAWFPPQTAPQQLQLVAHPGPSATASAHPLPLIPIKPWATPVAQDPPNKAEVDGVEGVEGKGKRAEKVAQHLRYTSRTRSVSPTSHRFPLPPVPVVQPPEPDPIPIPLVPQATSSSQSGALDNMVSSVGSLEVPLPSSCDQVPTALTQQPGVLSPRPKPSPRMKFDEASNGAKVVVSLKSKPVEALERMAEEILEQETGNALGNAERPRRQDKALPTPPLISPNWTGRINVNVTGVPTAHEVFGLGLSGAPDTAPKSALMPQQSGNVLSSPSSLANVSGLDALEKRLAGQKTDAAERWLARGRRFETNDSDTESIASGRSGRSALSGGRPRLRRELTGPREDPAASERERSQSRDNRPKKETGLPPMPMPQPIERVADPHEQEVRRLQKEAVKRVNRWAADVPDQEEPSLLPWATLSGQNIPTRSSGFVSTRKPPPLGLQPLTGLFTGDVPATSGYPSPPLPSPTVPMSPLHVAANVAMSPMLGVKKLMPDLEKRYDIRSARGGKGGVVTSVTSLWENNAATTKKETPVTPPKVNATKSPVFKVPALPASASQLVLSQPALLTSPTKPKVKETSPQRISSATSDPAVINGTMAKPFISSVASLVRAGPRGRSFDTNMGVIPESISTPQFRSRSRDPVSPSQKPNATPPLQGVGQAKLKELIAKYQNATKT
ncbi:hypothetical protein FRB95_010658 [Tulasnella sp. JGI-2019a]|nr:hypothetical protein FRB95_010658 [Tulasnella sp. JGI-2019a]